MGGVVERAVRDWERERRERPPRTAQYLVGRGFWAKYAVLLLLLVVVVVGGGGG